MLFKRIIFFIHLSFLFMTCFVLSLIQWLNFKITSKINNKLRLHINFLMQELIFSQFVVCMEWFCHTRVRVIFKDRKTFENHLKKPSFLIGNHRYETDFMFFILYTRLFTRFGTIRSFAKYELSQIPIFGWSFMSTEFIFLKRDWQKDKQTIVNSLKDLDKSIAPVNLIISPEGTRFNENKYQNAIAYAKENNLPLFKYHLIPRPKGFNFVLKHLINHYPKMYNVFNVEMCQQQDSYDINWKNFFKCKKMNADIYVEQVDNEKLPDAEADEQEYTKLLYDIFHRKDEIVEQLRNTSSFSDGEIVVNSKPSILVLIRCIIMNLLIGGTCYYYILYLAFMSRLTIIVFILIITIGTYLMFRSAKVSNYGEKKVKK